MTIKNAIDNYLRYTGSKSMKISAALIDCDGVFLKLLDPARAGVFMPSEQKAGEDLIVLQMPMMI